MIKAEVLKSVLVLLLGAVSGAAFAFMSQLLLARQLGPNSFGIYAASLATVTIAAPIAGFGIQGLWLNAFGEEGWRAVRWLKPSYYYIVLTTICVVVFVAVWAAIGPNSHEQSLLLMIFVLHALGQMSIEIVSGKLQLEERYFRLASMQSLPHLFRFIGVLSVPYIFAHYESLHFASAYAVVGAALVLLCVFEMAAMGSVGFCLKGHGNRSLVNSTDLSAPALKDVCQRAWPYGLAGIFYLLHFQIASSLLGYLSTPEEAGLYGAAMLVMNAVFIFPGVLYQKFLLPKQHRWAMQDREMSLRVFKFGNKVMLIVGAMLAILLLFGTPYAVPIFFGSKFLDSKSILFVLALSVPVRFLATSVGSVLVTGSHMKTKVVCMGVVAIFNVVLCLLLIPYWQGRGAATAFVLSEVLLLWLYWRYASQSVLVS